MTTTQITELAANLRTAGPAYRPFIPTLLAASGDYETDAALIWIIRTAYLHLDYATATTAEALLSGDIES